MRRWLIIVFCLLAVALRLWLSATKELSYDEFFTVTLGLGIPSIQSHFKPQTIDTAAAWMQAFQGIRQWADPLNFSGYRDDLNPPAYFIAMGPWMHVFPLQAIWLRLPSLLISLAGIALVYRLCRRFVSRDLAVFAAFVTGFSAIYLFYATLARPYEALLVLALLATEMLLAKRWRWYAASVFLGMLTHLFFLPIILAHGLYLAVARADYRTPFKPWLMALRIPIATVLLWGITVFFMQVSGHQGNAIFTGLPLVKLLWHHSLLSRWIFYCDKPLPRWPDFPLDFIASIGLWVIFLREIFLATLKKSGAWHRMETQLFLVLGLCWFLLPLLALTAMDALLHTRLSGTERYLYILSPGLLFMLIAVLASYPARFQRAILGILTILILLNTGLFLQRRGLPTENYQGLAERIRPELKHDDLVLTLTGYPALPALANYLPPQALMASVSDFSTHTPIDQNRLARLSHGHSTIWLIASYAQLSSLQPIQEVIHILEGQGYQLTRTLDMDNIRLGGYRLSRRQQ